MTIEKFSINVSEALLADLSRRLDATRWPDELENVGWELGSSLSNMKSLADYWRNAYEWRRQEVTLNQLPQYRVALDGFHVHFERVTQIRVTALIERTAQSNPRLHGSQKTVPGYFLNCISPQGGQAARLSKLYS